MEIKSEFKTLAQRLQERLLSTKTTNSELELAITWLQKNPEFEFVIKLMGGGPF